MAERLKMICEKCGEMVDYTVMYEDNKFLEDNEIKNEKTSHIMCPEGHEITRITGFVKIEIMKFDDQPFVMNHCPFCGSTIFENNICVVCSSIKLHNKWIRCIRHLECGREK